MIAATLHTPNNWAPNHDESSIEVFPSLSEAISALLDRYASNGKYDCGVRYLNGTAERVLFPTFESGARFEVYQLGVSNDFPLTEESIEEALIAVHGGFRDGH